MTPRAAVLGRVLANVALRRIELAFLGFGVAEYGVWVAVLVYAYEHGGTTTAAVIAVLQLVPAAVVAPLAARVIDSRGAVLVLRAGYLLQAVALGTSAGLMLSHAPAASAYAGAVVAASAVTLTRPAQGALLPSVVATPIELTAANAVTGWVESISLLVGPALAGLWISLDGPGAAIAFFAVCVAGSALSVAALAQAKPDTGQAAGDAPSEIASVASLLRRERGIVAVLGVMSLEFVALGALDVLAVVLALRELGLGASGAGYLNAAFGAGAVLGGIAALALVGRERIVDFLFAAALGWGASLVVLGVWPTVGGAFVLLGGAGLAHSVLDVSGRTLMHRVVPPHLYGRAFGLLEGLAMLGLAAGSMLVPLLVAIGGVGTALVAAGGLLVLGALATLGRLRTLERTAPARKVQLDLLRSSPIFSMLSAPVLAGLAQALVRQDASDGESIVREGEPGHHFYLVAAGQLDVTVAGTPTRTLGAGDGFGEIALLRDGVRTATVTAEGPVTVYALDRAPFLEAVTGSPQASAAAERVLAERLGAS